MNVKIPFEELVKNLGSRCIPEYFTEDVLLIKGQMQLFTSLLCKE